MTILVCIPCLLTGGTEIQTLNLVQALVGGGHRVVTVGSISLVVRWYALVRRVPGLEGGEEFWSFTKDCAKH